MFVLRVSLGTLVSYILIVTLFTSVPPRDDFYMVTICSETETRLDKNIKIFARVWNPNYLNFVSDICTHYKDGRGCPLIRMDSLYGLLQL